MQNKAPVLTVMAAGMGSRFGGLKQIAPIGPNGEILLDFSVYDALEAGFGKVVFIIKKAIEEPFREAVGKRIEKIADVEYVFQETDKMIPEKFASLVETREKPWGTAHAILCAKDALADYPKIIQEYLENHPNYDSIDFANFLKSNFSRVTLTHATFRLSTDSFIHHSRASIKIQDGCGNNCAYCRIHIARGKPVSLDAEEVISRVLQLEEADQKEVVLTGVNLSQYRSKFIENDVEKYIDFADLLKILIEKTSKINFRISSLYPDRVDSELAPILSHERVCPHFHLSVQSGSDNILKSMNRTYKRDVILDAVKRLREAKPNCFIACDIIAGFPGETDKDFECDFTWVHAFPFSPRPGTAAYSMKNKVPEHVSKKRVKLLTEFATNSKNRYLSNLISKEIPAIVEKRRFPEIRVVTNNFIHVKITNTEDFSDVDLGGKRVTIKITELCNNSSQTEAPEAYGIITKIN